MEGYLISQPTFYPSHLNTGYPEASFMPVLNYNNNRRVGFDFAANFNKKVGDVDLSLGVTGTYYTTKATKRDENNVEQYQNTQGKALDGIWGYKSAGLFQSEEEIKNSPDQSYFGGTVKPGDIKYVDVMVIIKLTNTTKSSWVRVVGTEHHSRLVSILQLSGRTLPSSLLVPVTSVLGESRIILIGG